MVLSIILALSILAPPAKFLPYVGPKLVIEKPVSIIAGVCRLLGSKDVAGVNSYPLACTLRSSLICVQFLPLIDGNLITADVRKQIDAHEDAHCNYWHHPGE